MPALDIARTALGDTLCQYRTAHSRRGGSIASVGASAPQTPLFSWYKYTHASVPHMRNITRAQRSQYRTFRRSAVADRAGSTLRERVGPRVRRELARTVCAATVSTDRTAPAAKRNRVISSRAELL
eukprot:703585-Rhodomonas_salina.1